MHVCSYQYRLWLLLTQTFSRDLVSRHRLPRNSYASFTLTSVDQIKTNKCYQTEHPQNLGRLIMWTRAIGDIPMNIQCSIPHPRLPATTHSLMSWSSYINVAQIYPCITSAQPPLEGPTPCQTNDRHARHHSCLALPPVPLSKSLRDI